MKKDVKICISKEDSINYFLSHNYNDNMFNSDGSINARYNSNKKTCLIAKILKVYMLN